MKYILTESQYKRITESKKHIQTFQDLIDRKLDYIRKVCDMGADDYEGDVGDEACNQIKEVEKEVKEEAKLET